MVDNSRGSGERRNDEDSGQVRRRHVQWRHPFANGFEGMNFEQIREPYQGGGRVRNGNGSPEAKTNERSGDE